MKRLPGSKIAMHRAFTLTATFFLTFLIVPYCTVDPTYHQGEVERRPDTAHDMSTILHDIREIYSTAASESAQVLHASRDRRLAVRHHR